MLIEEEGKILNAKCKMENERQRPAARFAFCIFYFALPPDRLDSE
jgi:hypothetical protein